MKILVADLVIPSWCSFRIPHAVNVHHTYPAPPPTTIYGLIANSLGLYQDDYTLRDKLMIGIGVRDFGETVETLTRWQKWNPSKGSMSTVLMKQKLIQPTYRIYIGAAEPLLQQMERSLTQPARLLYLGESDDSVEVYVKGIYNTEKVESNVVHNILPLSLAPNSSRNESYVVHWPTRFFQENRSAYGVHYELVCIQRKFELAEPISCLYLAEENEYIYLGENILEQVKS